MTTIKLRCLEVNDNEDFTVGKVYPASYVRKSKYGVLCRIMDDVDCEVFMNVNNSVWESKFRILLMPNVEPVK